MRSKLESLIYSLFLSTVVMSQYIRAPKLDSDILWSLAIGKWISTYNTYPVVDSFSWTINGKEWMTHEWLYSYLVYKLYMVAGDPGLYLITCIPVFFTCYFLYLAAKKYDLNNSYSFILILTLGVILLYLLSLPFRAYIYALFFFTVLIYLLYFKERKRYDLVFFIILFVVWANVQVSVFIGILVLIAETIRQHIINADRRSAVLTNCMLSVLCTFINPYGYKLWTYFIFMLSGMDESKNITEWRAVDFNEPSILILFLGLAASIIICQQFFRLTKPGRDKINIPESSLDSGITRLSNWVSIYLTSDNCLIIGFWSFYIYALYSIRMLVFAIILWIIVTAYFIGQIKMLNFTMRTYKIFITFLAVGIILNLIASDFKFKDVIEYDKKVAPVEEVTFLKSNPTYSQHLFNDYIFGGYLILNDIPVFIDARSDSYIKFGVQQKYSEISGLKVDPQELLEEFGVENILIKESPLAKYLRVNPHWQVVYEGPSAILFTKTER